MKTCRKCGIEKDAEKDFPWRKKDNCPDAWCNSCHSKYVTEWKRSQKKHGV